MHRDFKIGLICGMVVVVAATIYIATRPALSPKPLRPRRIPQPAPASSLVDTAPNAPDTLPPHEPHDPSPLDPNLRDWTIYEQPRKITTEKFHIVRKNETLSDIARQYYGSAAKWQKIYNANRDRLKNPDSVRPGTKLIIPE